MDNICPRSFPMTGLGTDNMTVMVIEFSVETRGVNGIVVRIDGIATPSAVVQRANYRISCLEIFDNPQFKS